MYRSPLAPGLAAPDTPLRNAYPEKDPYFPYPKFIDGLLKIVNRRNWTAGEIAAWFKPLADFLAEKAAPGANGVRVIPTAYMDCIARNVLVAPDGTFRHFDLEWSFGDEVMPLHHLLFYNLMCSCDSVHEAEMPHLGTPVGVWALAAEVMKHLGMPLSAEDEEAFLAWISGFHSQVLGFSSGGDYKNGCMQIRLHAKGLLTLLENRNEQLHALMEKAETYASENVMLRKMLEKARNTGK